VLIMDGCNRLYKCSMRVTLLVRRNDIKEIYLSVVMPLLLHINC
ncbi:hypothetical protein THOM_2145, partial [Trachipleistophora hominis]